jgi:hypothetical protein
MAPNDDTKITDNFPHKSIAPIVGQPTYETLKELHLKLNENAVKVHSNLGNGTLGYLGVTVEPAIYNTLSAALFIPPPNPGTAPIFPDDSTGPQIANIRVVFNEKYAAFNKYMAVCNAIASLIVEVIDPMYLASLRLPYVGIGTRTPLELLAHLYATYAKITPADLDANDIAMKKPCDVNQPIEVFFKQIEDATEFAAAGQAPYSPEQVLNIAYQLVFRTGIFVDDCKTWKKQPALYKNWPQFKIDFAVAYQEYNEALDIGPRAAGFNAESVSDYHEHTIDALSNLATATVADRTAVANLTETTAILTRDLAKSNASLVAALNQITSLTQKLADFRTGRPPPSTGEYERKHYCWTCGYRSLHSSAKCTIPSSGHQKAAKAADIMGGSTLNQPPPRT